MQYRAYWTRGIFSQTRCSKRKNTMKNTQNWGKTMDDVDEIMAEATRRRASNNMLVLILQGLTDSLDKTSTLLDSQLARSSSADEKT